MDRRTFLGTLAGGLLATPLVAEAQPAGKVRRLGLLLGGSPIPLALERLDAFRRGLGEHGYLEGRISP